MPPKARPLADRLWEKVIAEDNTQDTCLLWTGGTNEHGYGRINIGQRKVELAHRLAYMLFYGPIPRETPCILHTCDKPLCVRPDHLWAGTQGDNMSDATFKGRMGKKLTLELAIQLCMRILGGISIPDTARLFGVDRSLAYRIWWGLDWPEAIKTARLRQREALEGI